MTVQKLIDQLRTFAPDTLVFVADWGNNKPVVTTPLTVIFYNKYMGIILQDDHMSK